MAAVELALIIPALILILFGIMEFSYVWYVTNAITNASREGARYGSLYRNPRPDPRTGLSPSIESVVDAYLGPPSGPFKEKFWAVPPSTLTIGTGTTIPGAGNDLTVTVNVPFSWFLLRGLVPGLENVTLSGSTTMRLE